MSHAPARKLTNSTQPAPTSGRCTLADRVQRFLDDRLPDGTGVSVESHDSTVILRGRVSSPHEKWLCLECCKRVADVIHVVDDLKLVERYRPAAPR